MKASLLCVQLSYSCVTGTQLLVTPSGLRRGPCFVILSPWYPGQHLAQNRYLIHHYYGYWRAQFTIPLVLLFDVHIFSHWSFWETRELESHDGKDISQPVEDFHFPAHAHMIRSWIQDVSVISVPDRRNVSNLFLKQNEWSVFDISATGELPSSFSIVNRLDCSK